MRYLVNRETKEHVIYVPWLMNSQWTFVEADSEGWIAHTGKECPLPEGVRCEYKMRDGDLSSAKASNLRWSHRGINYDGDIVAYRPILEPEKVQEPELIPAPQYDPRSVSFNLLDRLKAAHKHAQQIPDLEAELREVLGSMGYDLVARSPFANQCCCNPAQCWEPCGELGRSEEHVAVSPEPDMTDWRNWREGDVLECSQPDVSFLFEGELVTIEFINEYGDIFIKENPHGFRPQNFRFHSRPSKGE